MGFGVDSAEYPVHAGAFAFSSGERAGSLSCHAWAGYGFSGVAGSGSAAAEYAAGGIVSAGYDCGGGWLPKHAGCAFSGFSFQLLSPLASVVHSALLISVNL